MASALTSLRRSCSNSLSASANFGFVGFLGYGFGNAFSEATQTIRTASILSALA